MTYEGWARLYKEMPKEENGIFSFDYSVFIYPNKWMAQEREMDKESKCLGCFPVRFDVAEKSFTWLPPLSGKENPEAQLELPGVLTPLVRKSD